MKKALFLTLTVILAVLMLAPSVYAAADRGKALIVHGTADAVGAGDKAVGDRLVSLGFKVDYILAKDSNDTSWKDYKLVFIGESVTSADVDKKFQKATCAVIVSEPGLMDEMLMGNYDTAYDSAAYTGDYTVKNDIVKSGLTTFKGFTSNDVIPGFLKEWGKGATIIAQNSSGSPAVTYFATGSELFDNSKAVGPRVQWFFRRQDASLASADTWKLFDAVVNFLLPVPVETTTAKAGAATAAAGTATKAAQTADFSVITWAVAAAASAGALYISKKRGR